MRKLLGIHSTSRSSAAHILEQGFKPSPLGRVGTGVYFWHYWHDDSYARHLALTWWRRNYKQGMFQEQGNPLAALLYVSVDVAKDSIFDISRGTARENIQKLIFQQINDLQAMPTYQYMSKTARDAFLDKSISNFYTAYFDFIKAHVVIANVPTPRSFIGDMGKFYSSAASLLVLPKELQRINILEYEEVDNEYT